MNRKAKILGNFLAIATLWPLSTWQLWMQAMQGETVNPIAAVGWVYLWCRTTLVLFDFIADLYLKYMDKLDREEEEWIMSQIPPILLEGGV